LILAGLAEIQLLQGRGQPDTHAERNDVVDLLGRLVLQGQLGERAEVHLLAVHEVTCLGQRREPVVDRVGGRQAAALEAHSRQQPVAAPAAGVETNSELLARFGLRSEGTLLADIGHLRVDSICLTVVTERASEAALTPNISLVVRRRRAGRTAEWVRQLNFPYQLRPPGSGLTGTSWVVKLYPHFEPAATNRFTVVVEDEQPLADITGIALRMGPDPAANDSRPHGTVWRPRRVMLEINGRVVQELTFRARAVPAGGELNLRYPPRRRQSGDGQLSRR
jgi:hypothetical protein